MPYHYVGSVQRILQVIRIVRAPFACAFWAHAPFPALCFVQTDAQGSCNLASSGISEVRHYCRIQWAAFAPHKCIALYANGGHVDRVVDIPGEADKLRCIHDIDSFQDGEVRRCRFRCYNNNNGTQILDFSGQPYRYASGQSCHQSCQS